MTVPDLNEVSHLQKTLRDRSAVVQALAGDLAKSNRAVHPQAILLRRVEYLIDSLFPPDLDETQTSAIPTSPGRLHLELGWLDELEKLHRDALRIALAEGVPQGLVVPDGRQVIRGK